MHAVVERWHNMLQWLDVKSLSVWGVSVVGLAAACGGTATTFPDGVGGSGGAGSGGAGANSTSGPGGSTPSTTTGPGGSGGGGPTCDFEPLPTSMCIRGEPNQGGDGEVLRAGAMLTVEVRPEGCFSSSCTEMIEVGCSAIDGAVGEFEITAGFCLEDTSAEQGGCTDDCGGGGIASCTLGALAQGDYVARLGEIELRFQVPSMVPVGGKCVGRPD